MNAAQEGLSGVGPASPRPRTKIAAISVYKYGGRFYVRIAPQERGARERGLSVTIAITATEADAIRGLLHAANRT